MRRKIASGDLHPDEPVFVLRARDINAATIVWAWCQISKTAGVPEDKINEARELAHRMSEWRTKQTPGRPETRATEQL